MVTTATSPDRDAALVRSSMLAVWAIALVKLIAHVWFNDPKGVRYIFSSGNK
jgi:hypothetical protein